ncbi:DUF3793 family protein [Clostridium malenominatum]|uniref:DUF3793 family protein n=1 Tax=Clostridium malenominatum TaxID=1539 RepID=A0ABN1J6X6_9CLOT
MSQVEVIGTLKMIKELEDKDYMFYMTAYNIGPVIQGNKPSCILTFSKDNKNLYGMWRDYGEEFLTRYNVEAFKIKDTGETFTVLFYKKHRLENQIFNSRNISFLNQFGYTKEMDLGEVLEILKKRYEDFCPHEIGIFLGIPLDDVEAFMHNPKEDFITYGYWKVYYNLEEALETFKAYDDAKIRVLRDVRKEIKPWIN